ncbi:acyl-CoA synthetase [Nocardia salmonicida]|uniref:acyl-CoA synthetase n=1 Tax=Nocardia salmonicida TaxID=53431 RepID=UPI003670D1FF
MTISDRLWPTYATPADIDRIEQIPLGERGLPATTYEMLHRAALSWPDRPAVSVLPDGQRWRDAARHTFARLLAEVHRAANMLHDHGIRRGDAVALIAPNSDELITATLAAQLAGIAAPINGSLSDEHVGQLIRRAGARVLITSESETDPAIWQTIEHLVDSGLIDTVFLLRPTDAPATPPPAPRLPGARVEYFLATAQRYPDAAFSGEPPTATDLAALFHTGGTTGAPKLAAHSHANEVADAWMIAANATFDEDSVIFAALPLFNVNALVVTLLAPMFRGQHTLWAGPLGYRDPALYANFWKIVEHYRLATMSAVPTVYSVLAQIPVDADISSMRLAVVGASALPDAVRKDFESHTGIPLIEGYGLTEATCASARSFPDFPRPGSVGQRLPYQHLKTVRIDENGTLHDMPRGAVGTLVIKGPTVFPGYVLAHDAYGFRLDGMGKLLDGWLDTGDLARIDDDGFVHLVGRAKDLIIRGGHNIDPATIEDALLAHPDVTGAAAVGRPDIHAGEVPVAYVTLRSDATCTPDDLITWAREQVAESAAAPKAVTVIEAIPVTAVGKPYKLPLRADAARGVIGSALLEVPGIVGVRADTEDGTAVVTITLSDVSAHDTVADILARYSLMYRIVTA